jgi:hypothetical protein
VTGTHVTQATPNVIDVSGEWQAGAAVDGFFDRLTGHGKIFEYTSGEKPSLSSKVHKMFLLQCEAANRRNSYR